MRIVIVANDSRGGVQPYLALGVGLRRAGHEPVILAPSDFAGMAEEAGIPFAPLSGSVEEAARRLGGGGQSVGLRTMRVAAREMQGLLATWTREALAACEGNDLVLGGIGGMAVARSSAEKLRIPFVEAHLQPLGISTDRYPGPLLAGMPRLGGVGWRLSHRATAMAVWMPLKGAMERARHDVLGLEGPMGRDGDGTVLYGFSRHVVPLPGDRRRTRLATGYWVLPTPEDWVPPPGLEAFIAADGPVVSIGFGSMAADDPAAMTEMVAGAVRDAGVRAVLLSGWGALAAHEHPDLFVVDAVPHDWLFPRVRAVVHHGGAGTTGAGLRGGVPSVVVPFGMDQPFWASRVRALGAGPDPIPRKRLTRDRLADALRTAVTDRPMQAAAAGVGRVLRQEDGLAAAIAALERLAH